MKPGPAISGDSIQSDAGSAATRRSAILRGGAFSARASCIAALVA